MSNQMCQSAISLVLSRPNFITNSSEQIIIKKWFQIPLLCKVPELPVNTTELYFGYVVCVTKPSGKALTCIKKK